MAGIIKRQNAAVETTVNGQFQAANHTAGQWPRNPRQAIESPSTPWLTIECQFWHGQTGTASGVRRDDQIALPLPPAQLLHGQFDIGQVTSAYCQFYWRPHRQPACTALQNEHSCLPHLCARRGIQIQLANGKTCVLRHILVGIKIEHPVEIVTCTVERRGYLRQQRPNRSISRLSRYAGEAAERAPIERSASNSRFTFCRTVKSAVRPTRITFGVDRQLRQAQGFAAQTCAFQRHAKIGSRQPAVDRYHPRRPGQSKIAISHTLRRKPNVSEPFIKTFGQPDVCLQRGSRHGHSGRFAIERSRSQRSDQPRLPPFQQQIAIEAHIGNDAIIIRNLRRPQRQIANKAVTQQPPPLQTRADYAPRSFDLCRRICDDQSDVWPIEGFF